MIFMGAIYRNGVPYTGGTIAGEISYDNTTSGMTADNVQDAIDELKAATVDGKDVAYDNTDSGMSATNIQDAIDELYRLITQNDQSLSTNEGD